MKENNKLLRVWFPELIKDKEAAVEWVNQFVEYYLMRQIQFTSV
jgi:hypothetical protein